MAEHGEDQAARAPATRIDAEVVVPDGGLVAIEYPGYVRNVGRALETFGGARALGAMLAAVPAAAAAAAGGAAAAAAGAPPPAPCRLQLRLRPADALSHPLTSDAPVLGRRALLLRIARPAAARRRRREAGQAAADGDGGGDDEGRGAPTTTTMTTPTTTTTITAAGLVTCTYRFTSLADAQYLPLDGRAGAPSGCGGVAGAGADLSAGGGRDVASLPPDAQPPAAEAFGAPAPFLMVPPRFLASGAPVEYDFADGAAAGGGAGDGAADGAGGGASAAAATAAAAAEAAAAASVAAAEAAAEAALAAVLRQRLATIEFGAPVAPRSVPLDRAAEYLARRTDRALRSAASAAAAAAQAQQAQQAQQAAAAAGAEAEAGASAAEPEIPTESVRPQLDAFVARLDGLFAERRAWLEPVLRERSGLDALASAAEAAAAEAAQQQAATAADAAAAAARSVRARRLARDAAALLRAAVYRFRTGPWRSQLVRRSYDPRRDAAGSAPLQGVKAARPPAGAGAAAAAAAAADAAAAAEPPSAVRVYCQLRAPPPEFGRAQWRVQARDVEAAARLAAAAARGGSEARAPPPPPSVPPLAPVRGRRAPTETTGWLTQTTLRELSVAATALYARAAAVGAGDGAAAAEEEEEEAEAEQQPPAQQEAAVDVDEGGGGGGGGGGGAAAADDQEDEEGAAAMEDDEDAGGGSSEGAGALDDAAALSTDEGAR